ncbi:MAG TPA: cyclopropane-fatty-acyl-phospholipid synthase family protein [Steroidobacteraceae bacterium]|nr:cyclopropane-fatty-acyl-phospholipid synthase family protein [Steroidobacteraceae bacterium]
MNDTTLIELSRAAPRPNPLGVVARHAVLARLAMLSRGLLRLRDGDSVHAFGDGTGPEATITVRDPAFYSEVAWGGSVGAAESYMLGHWRADDLTALMRVMLLNHEVLDNMEGGLARLSSPLRRFAHWLHRNTRAGSRRNIRAHYDLGNDFFRLMLDETMMYSCALFERPEMTLAEASTAKLERICRALALGPSDHVLEIGTGWGGFALHAASRHGCRVTTTTISPSQFELARERIRAAGLEDRVTLLLEDYRDLRGSYDKAVSIEMIEAIGHRQYGKFFRQCAQLLVPGGRMLLQTITIADRHYARTRDEVDFIKRYIFPGACLPAISALAQAMADSSDLRIVALQDIGPHYATTLAHWRASFLAQLAEVRAMGYPETFIRMWDFYLCYCEAGFAERQLGDVQMLLAREG